MRRFWELVMGLNDGNQSSFISSLTCVFFPTVRCQNLLNWKNNWLINLYDSTRWWELTHINTPNRGLQGFLASSHCVIINHLSVQQIQLTAFTSFTQRDHRTKQSWKANYLNFKFKQSRWTWETGKRLYSRYKRSGRYFLFFWDVSGTWKSSSQWMNMSRLDLPQLLSQWLRRSLSADSNRSDHVSHMHTSQTQIICVVEGYIE